MAYKSVQELFDATAGRFPDHIAITRGGENVTYAELRRRSDLLAHALRAAGSEKGAVVAVLLENPVTAITAILATLKAGAAFVPLDAQIPALRLASMLADVSPDWFITESKFLDRVEADSRAHVMCVGAAAREAGAAREVLACDLYEPLPDTPLLPVVAAPDDLCYIYFTSGSTGRPKGIAGRLKGIDHFIRWEIETLGIGEGDRVSQLLPLSFDGSLRDVFVPLCSGATVCVPPDAETILDAGRLMRWIDTERISLIHCIPSLLRMLLGETLTPDNFAHLRYVLLSGEPLLPADVGRWASVFGERVQLINLYGTSETTMAKFVYYVRAVDQERRSIPVGKPMPGAKALIVDEEGRACPQGTVGEIYIRTPYRSLGYYRRPELTERVFIPNPFNNDPNDIVYKTGDLGRVLEDGNVELLGRKDQQVKIRGVRIELDEIEGLLRALDGIEDAVVVDREDGGGNKFLCAYVVGERATEQGAMRECLRQQLPDYMIPSAFVALDSLPRTISGKVDRRALPSLARALAERGGEYEPPRTPVEEMVAGLWGELLGAGRVGRQENFFELGGHSLLATQVVSRVREVLGAEVGLRQLFERPTVEGFAREVEAARASGGAGAALPPLVREEREGALPLSYAQQRLWFIDQLGSDDAVYNVPGALRLIGELNVHALEQTVSEIIRRHEALRTAFSSAGGQPVQIITPPFEFDLPVTDLTRLPESVRERERARLVGMEARKPFDLGASPLLRARLLKLKEREYLLFFVMHHIVSDGWSLGVLVRELGALYRAYKSGASSGLAELRIQYADYAKWQRNWMDGEILDAELAYWKGQLAGAPPVLELPTDRPRPAIRSSRGKTHSFVLPKELTADLERLCRREGVTLFMLMLLAFDILFQRYTGQDDIVVGTPVANRTRSETNELIGFFVNTLVLRTDMRGAPTFRELLRRVRETALGAYAHQNLPFERLVEELQPERSLSHTPLFQVVIVLHNAPLGKLELPGLALRPEEADSETAKFDLTVNMQEQGGELYVSMTYSTDLFDAATVERMGEHLRALLDAGVRNAELPVSELSFLKDDERRRLIERHNETAATYPSRACIHELFAAQAARTPNAVAAEFQGEALTYGELDRRADHLARRLRARGVGVGARVGIFLEHSLETVIGLLAVLKAGAAYVPLDAEHPKARLAYAIADAGLLCILTQQRIANRLPAADGCEVLPLDAPWPDESPGRGRALPQTATADDTAYVIYTSGSTGRPKGVKVQHRALVNYIWWAKRVYARDEPLSFPLYSSLAFDLTVTSIYTPLLTGGRLLIYRPDRWQSPVSEILKDDRVDVLKLTPSHLALIKDSDNGGSRVRLLIVGGEALGTRLAEQVFESFGRAVEIVNEYGPTEATVGCMYYRFDETEQRRFVPAGRAAANMQVFVLDENLRPVPEGVAGELYISGDGLAESYLHRADLTAQRFVPHPFIEGCRMYKSGDTARWLSNGSMEYIGRNDEQVKYHGHRVELNEIRSALNLYPQVRDSIVLLVPDSKGKEVLLAYYVSRHEIAAEQLRTHLSEHVIRETIPNIFVHIKRLPLTLNGKVDRSALPSLAELDGRRTQRSYEPPRTPVEEMVAGLWGELLGAGRVGRQENFFELGGHSLLATQVVSRVREVLGAEVGLRQLFERPTVEGFAREVEAARAGASGRMAEVPPLVRTEHEGALPLSYAQQRLWFLDQLEPGASAYNMPAALLLRGRLNLPSLRQSLDELVRRHESLRTTFTALGGTPVQIIAPASETALPVTDLGALDAAGRESEMSKLAAVEAARPFDLEQGPLFRVSLVRLGAAEHALLFTVHHIVSDGWSVAVLVKEVMRLYEAYERGEPSPLEELKVQYADFAVWQRGWLRGRLLEEKLDYWRRQLAGAPAALELPTDRPRPSVQTFTGASIPLTVPMELSQKVRALCQREDVTLFMLLLAVFNVLLYRYTGQREIVVGTGVANRDHPATERLIGFFINMLVLRTDVGDNLTFAQLLGRVREVCLGAYEHRDVPFEKLVDELQVTRDMSRQPLFQVVFVLQNTPETTPALPGLQVSPLHVEGGMAHFDLTMSVAETPDGLAGSLEYNADLFDAPTIQLMAEHYLELLEGLVADPAQGLLALPLPRARGGEVAASDVLVYDDRLLAERDYWHSKLAGAQAAVIPRPSVRSRDGSDYHDVTGEIDPVGISIGEDTVARLERLTGGSPFLTSAVLLAVLKVYLHKDSGAETVPVATPATADLGAANSVVTVDEVRDEQSFQNFLLSVRESLLAAYARQQYPYLRLLKELKAQHKQQNGNGVEDAGQPVHRLDAVTLEFEGFHGEPARGARQALRLRFRRETLNGHGANGGAGVGGNGDGGNGDGSANGRAVVRGWVEYDPRLYSRDGIERFSNRFTELLGHALRETSRPIGELEMLTTQERERILWQWNNTRADYPSTESVHQLFERQVERTPDAVALIDGEQHLSYREVNARANRLARHLRSLGVGAERLVGIFMERSADMVVAVLASLKAGAAYLPLDVNYPRERLRFMAANAEVTVLLTQAAWKEAAPDAACPVVCLDAESACFASRSGENLSVPVSSDNIAYVIYTSGSTGRPKGVMVSHRGLVNYLSWAGRAYGVSEGAGALLHSPLGFDLTVTSLFTPLMAGKPVVIVGEREGVTGLVDALARAEQPYSLLKLTPSHLNVLRETLGGWRDKVRVLIVGGEALRTAEVRQWHEESPDTKVVNEYGPTETVVGCCVYEAIAASEERPAVDDADRSDDAPTIPIGRPIANTRLYILDPNQKPVPPGIVGELYIGGAGVARGYQRRADLTAELFLCDPFSRDPGERMYRTGDMARYLDDGNIEFLGRKDAQVKIRGYRIELGEIENVLRQHDGVRDCVVLTEEGQPWERRLVAYLAADEQELSVSELHRYLVERLPSYMIPSAFVVVDSIPLTSNGKVDRRALPSLGRALAERGGEYEPPRTPVEEMVAGLWGELLGAGRVGRQENFFELGGHSLLATQVVSRVREVLGAEVGLRQLFERPTVEGFAREVEAARAGGGASAALPPLVRTEHEGALPLSYAQQRLWFLDQLEPGNPLYNTPQVMRISGALVVPALEYTLNEIVRRHEALRTKFVSAEGQTVQVISPPAPVSLPVIDLTGEDNKEETARELIEAEIRRPFDLTSGTLLRVQLLKLEAEEYIFIFSTHHIVSDGWSLGVMIREVTALYTSYLAGAPSPLPELDIQYADFAVWQRGWLQGEVLERQLAYWRQRLGDAPAALALPTDRPRPLVRTHRGARLTFDLPADLARELRALSRREGATLFMTLLATWQLLLARHSGQDDICVGTPIANRNRIETESLIGFFVNTLVMRTRVSPGESFAELLKQVREVCLEAYAHQDVPFEKVVEDLQPDRGPGTSPLFQVMFALQNATTEVLELPGVKLSPVEGEVGMTKYDLELSMFDGGDSISGLLEFDEDLFDASTAGLIAARFKTLLESVVSDPGQDVATLTLLSPEERRQVLVEWSEKRSDYPRESSIQALFEEQAERTPDAIALVFGDEELSYGEMNRRANGLAHYLRAQGVGAEVLVGVSAERAPEAIIALLAILKAGGAYVPLDANYPAQRLRYMIEDAGLKLLLAGRGGIESWDAQRGRVISIYEALEEGRRLSQKNPVHTTGGDNLAYVMYTSGSTGWPKGVSVPHRGVVRLVKETTYASFGAGEVFLQFAPMAFDASTLEIWGSLLNGGRLVIMPPEMPTLEQLGQAVRHYGVTTLWLTTGLFHLMVNEHLDALLGLEQMLTGGEVLSVPLVRKFLDAVSSRTTLVNAYGPTESTTFTTCHTVRELPSMQHSIPVGRPIENTEVYILDGQMQPVAAGITGELYIGGDGLARGYHERAGLTAERFVAHPFGREAGARLYRTGDLVRYVRDGNIEFIGRLDHQVKVRGFRVEIGEVEAAIGRRAGVKACAVVAKEDGAGNKVLVAYVAAEKAAGSKRGAFAAEVRDQLRDELPEYMIPGLFVELESLPLTANGKVDKAALPDAAEEVAGETGGARPSPVAEIIAGMWANVFGVPHVGSGEDFFSLGGHSLLATQLVSRTRKVFNVEIPLRSLFENPTVETFAAVVEESLREAETLALPPLERADRAGALPLSFGQRRLWFFDQFKPGDTFYNMPAAFRLTGRPNIPALEDALSEVVRRHEALRTVFNLDNGEASQNVIQHVRVELPLADLSRMSKEEREACVGKLAESESRRPFDLASGPLVRFRLLKLEADGYVMLVSMHHIVSDGWSLEVFVREASDLYNAYHAGLPSPLPELAIQYPDYAVWQRGWLQGEVLETQLGYWKRHLAGAPELLALPSSKPRPPVQSARGGLEALSLSPELTDALKELRDREGVTLFMLMLAAFQSLLSWQTGQTDIVVGSPIAGRNHAETEPLIGFFVNTLVMRTDLGGDPSFRDLLKRVRGVALGAYAHQDVPFEMLVDELAPERSLSYTPLFQVVLGLQNAPPPPAQLTGIAVEGFGVPVEVARFDLELLLIDTAPGMDAALTYSLDLFEAGDARRLLYLFESLLRSVVADPDATLRTLFAALDEADARQRTAEEAEFKAASRRSLKNVRRRVVRPTPV